MCITSQQQTRVPTQGHGIHQPQHYGNIPNRVYCRSHLSSESGRNLGRRNTSTVVILNKCTGQSTSGYSSNVFCIPRAADRSTLGNYSSLVCNSSNGSGSSSRSLLCHNSTSSSSNSSSLICNSNYSRIVCRSSNGFACNSSSLVCNSNSSSLVCNRNSSLVVNSGSSGVLNSSSSSHHINNSSIVSSSTSSRNTSGYNCRPSSRSSILCCGSQAESPPTSSRADTPATETANPASNEDPITTARHRNQVENAPASSTAASNIEPSNLASILDQATSVWAAGTDGSNTAAVVSNQSVDAVELREKPLTVGASSDPKKLGAVICRVLQKFGVVELHSISYPNHFVAVKAIAMAQDVARGKKLETTMEQVPLPFEGMRGGKALATKLICILRYDPKAEAEDSAGSVPSFVPDMYQELEALIGELRTALNEQGAAVLEVKSDATVKRALKSLLAMQTNGWKLKAYVSNGAVRVYQRRNDVIGQGVGIQIKIVKA